MLTLQNTVPHRHRDRAGTGTGAACTLNSSFSSSRLSSRLENGSFREAIFLHFSSTSPRERELRKGERESKRVSERKRERESGRVEEWKERYYAYFYLVV